MPTRSDRRRDWRAPPNKAAFAGFAFALLGFLVSVSMAGYLIYLGVKAYFTGGN
jgi:hypothetical protein